MAMSKEQLQASSTALLTRAEEAGLTLPGMWLLGRRGKRRGKDEKEGGKTMARWG